MGSMNNFQIVVLLLFAVMALTGVVFFALFRGFYEDADNAGRVVIWGTVPTEQMSIVLSNIMTRSRFFNGVSYVEKDPESLSDEYVRALAEGRGPNLLILPHDLIHTHNATLAIIPFSSYPERTFRDTFVEGAELYLKKEGLYGVPYSIDPMVLYWNRTFLSNKGFSQPPKYWDEVFSFAPKITEKDAVLNIRKSAIALGEFSNIEHAKEILSSLMLQAGTPITGLSPDRAWMSMLDFSGNAATVPSHDVLRYFTEFSNPTKSVYSWNKSLPDAKQAFANGDLAFYLGFASEAEDIEKANPNLNFDIAPFPQTREDQTASVYARFTALAIPKAAGNFVGALKTAYELTSPLAMSDLVFASGLPPVRRDLLAKQPQDPYLTQFYRAAIISEAWYDPNPRETETIFRTMVDSVTTGRSTVQEAISGAGRQINASFRK